MNSYGAVLPQSALNARGFTRGRGYRTQLRYVGTAPQIQALEGWLVANGTREYQADYNTTPAVLLVTLDEAFDGRTVESQVENQWSMSSTRETLSIWEHPSVKDDLDALYTAGGPDAIAQVRANIDEAIATGVLNTQLTAWVASYSDLGWLVTKLCNKQDTWQRDRYVIRNTRTWPARTVFTPDYANANKTMTSSQVTALASSEGYPIPFTLPTATWFTSIGSLDTIADGKLQQVRVWEQVDADAWKYDAV